jgi:hypothetical protein
VAVALEKGLVRTIARADGPYFLPAGSLRRLDAADLLLNLLDLRQQQP